MVLLDCEEFLQELTKMVTEDSKDSSKSLWITYKRSHFNPFTSDIPNTRTWKRKKAADPVSDEEPVCLIRAKIGKRKISTYVTNSISENFTNALNHISESMAEGT
ncbi:uncharacterized protein TOT_030000377 [Theileria orientalis strain Shintoku]|uniref:Signal recognition particle 14 kDa protein n=1 Tax=Theileria orientalis strain Shintoku TaxID=869250 RepID=J4DPQ5_THEOR|nr:uncharacterized protein TOT_030000377 [Theileria orientalis strain Shintoku]BAM41114.1 uncharacterized protein TOT_030000377 [Theileria orientalis strain Shintoku]|eukprot:XP_009691415.1 uncharacterized protein TOT_030000377 [Theileria orientalis strain Shintoku]